MYLYQSIQICEGMCVLVWVGVSYMPEFCVSVYFGWLAFSTRQRWTE